MENFGETLLLAKQGNMNAMDELLKQYEPLLKKCSRVQGKFDMDLYQTLALEFVQAVASFRV